MQEIFKVPTKRNSLIGSVVFHLILLMLFLIFGFTEPDPLPEAPFVSVSLALGNETEGGGDEPTANPSEAPPTEEEEPQPEEVVTQPTVTEEVATEETSENTVQSEATTEPPVDPTPVAEPEPENPFRNAFSKPKVSGGGGSAGDKNNIGAPGPPDGTKDGIGQAPGNGGGGYSLGGRKALVKIKPKYNCQETGTVVITVRVDRNGKTTSVEVDGKNSDNLADCLTKAAMSAAKQTKWEAQSDAPTVQFGSITYVFEIN